MGLPTTDCIAVIPEGHLPGGDKWVNVLHYNRPEDFDLTVAGSIGIDVVDAYEGLLPFQGDDYSLEKVTFKDLSADPPVVYEYTVSPPVTGSSEDDDLPPQLAAVVSWRTAVGGRAGRGRTYIAGLAENANTEEAGPSGALITALNTWAETIRTIGEGLVVISYFQGHTFGGSTGHKTIPTPRVAPLVNDVVTGSANVTFGTMRSRNNRK